MLLNKARKSLYEKDKTFYKYYLDLEDKNVLYESQKPKAKKIFVLPLSNRKKDSDWLSTLNNIKGPFKLLHADVADIQFFFLSQELIQNIVYWLWIFSLLKCTFIL